MRFDILTIFPEFFGALPDQGILGHGVVSRALRTNLASAHIHDLRAFTHDRHRTVDDRPFGGGEGMVLKPQPIAECLSSLGIEPKRSKQLSYPMQVSHDTNSELEEILDGRSTECQGTTSVVPIVPQNECGL